MILSFWYLQALYIFFFRGLGFGCTDKECFKMYYGTEFVLHGDKVHTVSFIERSVAFILDSRAPFPTGIFADTEK